MLRVQDPYEDDDDYEMKPSEGKADNGRVRPRPVFVQQRVSALGGAAVAWSGLGGRHVQAAGACLAL